MNDVQTFTADTMQDALQQVRATLGPDAVIVHTRQVPVKSYLPWKKQKHETEITAMIDASVPQRTKPVARPRQIPPAKHVGRNRISASIPDDGVSLELSTTATNTQTLTENPTKTSSLKPAESENTFERSPSITRNEATFDYSDRFEQRLNAIEQLIEKLSHQMPAGDVAEIPDDLFSLYSKLIEAEVPDDMAREFALQLKQYCTPDELKNESLMRSRMAGLIRNKLRCCGPIQVEQGRQKIAALVGPTGVGKTTTIAKLAANFRLREGIKMGLVTVDTYRIAAVEQLRTYAEIIDLPMKVVTSPTDLRRALDEFAGLDLVLIDTAGRSPKDELKIKELKSLLGDAQIDEIHLVLSTIANAKTLKATAEKFSAVNLSSMILTKLDEVDSIGSVLATQREIGLPISYITTGQDVPDDIEPADGDRLASLILGQEAITHQTPYPTGTNSMK